MSETQAQVIDVAERTSEPLATPHRYVITPEGRRRIYLLLAGLAALWHFAFWSLVTLFADGLSVVDFVSLALMTAILLVIPVAAWALLEDANGTYRVEADGLRYTSLGGVDIKYDWANLSRQEHVRPNRLVRFLLGSPDEDKMSPPDGSEGDDDLGGYLVPHASVRTRNPLARILHQLAHGDKLHIPSDLAGRGELLRQVEMHRSGILADAVNEVLVERTDTGQG